MPRRARQGGREGRRRRRRRATLKAKELPKWLHGEAERLGVTLERGAAQALVAHVGDRQQRLLRELEKLALELGPGARIGADEVEAAAAPSAERQVWGLVDALVAGDGAATMRAYLELAAQGESLARLVPLLARRVREVLAIAQRLEAGETPRRSRPRPEGQPVRADRRHRRRRAPPTPARCAARSRLLADLELASRGQSELADDTVAPARHRRDRGLTMDRVGAVRRAALLLPRRDARRRRRRAPPSRRPPSRPAPTRAPRACCTASRDSSSRCSSTAAAGSCSPTARARRCSWSRAAARGRGSWRAGSPTLAGSPRTPGAGSSWASATARRTPRPRTAAPPASTPSHPARAARRSWSAGCRPPTAWRGRRTGRCTPRRSRRPRSTECAPAGRAQRAWATPALVQRPGAPRPLPVRQRLAGADGDHPHRHPRPVAQHPLGGAARGRRRRLPRRPGARPARAPPGHGLGGGRGLAVRRPRSPLRARPGPAQPGRRRPRPRRARLPAGATPTW